MRRAAWILLVSLALAQSVASQTMSTIAGTRSQTWCGDGGAATSACLNYPSDIAADAAGNLFVVDNRNNRIRKVSASGVISTVAGNGTPSFGGDGGPAVNASLYWPWNVAVDGHGKLFISDTYNHRVRKVTSLGTITTVAGSGPPWPDGGAFAGDGGPATAARLRYPLGIAVDALGNLFIADAGNHRIRRVDTAGIITTVAGNGSASFCGDGVPATSACLVTPRYLALHGGDLYFSDEGAQRVRRIDTAGIITTVAGNGTASFCGDGGSATSACLKTPYGVAVDGSGNLFIGDGANNRVRKVNPARTITTFAGIGSPEFCGDGGLATAACVNFPQGVTLDAAGRLLIADAYNGRIRRVAAGLASLTLAKPAVSGCLRTSGKVTLAAPAPAGGLRVSLSSDNPNAHVPTGVTIAAGATTKSFAITTDPVAAAETATIEASAGGLLQHAALTLKPMAPKSVTLSPNPVAGGTHVAGTVALECAAGPGDITLTLWSTKPATASPDTPTVTVPAGSTSAPFGVGTRTVAVLTKPSIKAQANGVTKAKVLAVSP
jgi:sugar lactone lactonase YvrE